MSPFCAQQLLKAMIVLSHHEYISADYIVHLFLCTGEIRKDVTMFSSVVTLNIATPHVNQKIAIEIPFKLQPFGQPSF